MNYKMIIALVLAGVCVIFIFQNIEVVQIHFLLWSFAMSRSLLVILLLVMGIAIGWLLHGFLRVRRRKANSDL